MWRMLQESQTCDSGKKAREACELTEFLRFAGFFYLVEISKNYKPN